MSGNYVIEDVDVSGDMYRRLVFSSTPNIIQSEAKLVSGLSIICRYFRTDITVITKLPNSEQSYKEKVKTHKYINRQNQSTTGKL